MRLFSKYSGDGFWWFRFGSKGPGIKAKQITKHLLLFSERNGYTKFIRIGKWIIAYLKPSKI